MSARRTTCRGSTSSSSLELLEPLVLLGLRIELCFGLGFGLDLGLGLSFVLGLGSSQAWHRAASGDLSCARDLRRCARLPDLALDETVLSLSVCAGRLAGTGLERSSGLLAFSCGLPSSRCSRKPLVASVAFASLKIVSSTASS